MTPTKNSLHRTNLVTYAELVLDQTDKNCGLTDPQRDFCDRLLGMDNTQTGQIKKKRFFAKLFKNDIFSYKLTILNNIALAFFVFSLFTEKRCFLKKGLVPP